MEALILQRAFVTVADAAEALQCARDSAEQQLHEATVSLAERGAEALFSVVSESATRRDHRITLCWGEREVAKLRESEPDGRSCVYAAVLPTASCAAPPRRPLLAAALRPRAVVEARSYPLVTRASLEEGTRAGAAMTPLVSLPPQRPPTVAGGKGEEVPAALPPPLAPPSVKTEQGRSASDRGVGVAAAAVPTRGMATPVPAPVAALATPPTVATSVEAAADTVAAAAEPALPVKRQPSLFDMMKAASAQVQASESGSDTATLKRPRVVKGKAAVESTPKTASAGEEEQQPTKPSRSRKPKAPKTDSTAATTSIAKLARASAKNRKAGSAAPQRTYAPMAGLLDDEEEHSSDSESDAEGGGHAGGEPDVASHCPSTDPWQSAEASVLDVTVTVANDDIVICDDAPPLAFLAPAHSRACAGALAAGPTPPGDIPGTTRAQQSVGNTTRSAALGAFFNTELVNFQKGFARKLRTEMVKDADGEYTCSDVVYYEATDGSGVCLTEAEYHGRSAELARAPPAERAPASTPSRSDAGGEGTDGGSPPSAAASAKHSTRPSVSKIAPSLKSSAPLTRTLTSFFKPAT